MKFGLSKPSLSHAAFTSQGWSKQGSGTVITLLIKEQTQHYDNNVHEQLNPSPSVNGSKHLHVKLALSNPSLVQSAFTSHGSDRQGSGTVYNCCYFYHCVSRLPPYSNN